ncbi:MAG: hypothetical protein AAF921_26190 [Cyanobacteria bacterium P01_D01_bin.44]
MQPTQQTHLKNNLLRISWLIFVILILLSTYLIALAVGAHYHPNSRTAPYIVAITTIYPIILLASLLLAVCLSLARKRLSAKAMNQAIFRTYAMLGLGVVATMLLVKPVPAYFVQHVGNVPYRIPREFTGIQSNQPSPDSAVRIDLCLETFQGKYSTHPEDCRTSIVILSQRLISVESFNMSYFFDNSDVFSNVDDQIQMTAEADKYQVKSFNGLRSYIASLNSSNKSYFQIDESNNLIRFASCHGGCVSFVKTSIGTLQYPYQTGGFSTSNFEEWVSMEKKLVKLISSWRIGAS